VTAVGAPVAITTPVFPRAPLFSQLRGPEAGRLLDAAIARVLSMHKGQVAYVKTTEVVKAAYALIGFRAGRRTPYPIDLAVAAEHLRKCWLISADGAAWRFVREEVRTHHHLFLYRRLNGSSPGSGSRSHPRSTSRSPPPPRAGTTARPPA